MNNNQVIYKPNGMLTEFNQILDLLKHQAKGRPAGRHLKSSTKSKSKGKQLMRVASVVYVKKIDIIIVLVL